MSAKHRPRPGLAGPVSLHHVLLTRFNLRVGDTVRGLDPGWLAHRLRVFSEICLPSIERQSRQEFTWLVFFDERTPEPARREVERLRQRYPFDPIWLDGEFSSNVASQVVRDRAQGHDHVITTRLDSDDALHREFMARVQREFVPGVSRYINFPLGCQLAGGQFYLRPYLGSPFLSLIEPAGDHLTTVFAAAHWRPDLHRPLQVWTLWPAWLQLIHGHNLANEMRGVWIRPDRPAAAFDVPAGYLDGRPVGRLTSASRRARSLPSLALTRDLARRLAALRALTRR